MTMRYSTIGKLVFGAAIALTAVGYGREAKSDGSDSPSVNIVYGNIPADQAEFLSTPDRIISVASQGAPTAIWEALEHGESVECLDCVAAVAPLLYDANARNREISAWWLRRRSLGVFGAGEVYQQTLNTLASDASATRRAYAANALGEFLIVQGIAPVAKALTSDSDPGVRAAAAAALGRLNDDGSGALATAMSDSDVGVRNAAIKAAGLVNTFSGTAAVTKALGDSDPTVRRHAVNLLDQLGAKASVASVIALAQNDADTDVRIAACHALGTFADPSAKAALTTISTTDKSSLVQDVAAIALIQVSR